MKRVFAIFLALVMILSMSITAFADDNGSVTITNATAGQTYNIYKIFDATYSNADGTKAVSYTIDSTNKFFNDVTNTEEGKKFFVYSAETGVVTKKEGVNDSELITYLNGLVAKVADEYERTAVADSDTVIFDQLPYGYYLITSTLGATVTINSNTPDVTVIDKNQKPGTSFDKVIVEGNNEVNNNTAAYGDTVNYKITLGTTNYDGDKHIQYYQIIDTAGSSLEIDWTSFAVSVGGQSKVKGWVLNNTTETNAVREGKNTEWASDNPEKDDIHEAEWYLVYLGNNQFRVTIPWQADYSISGNTGGWKIEYPLDAQGNAIDKPSIYTSPSSIVVTYNASVKDDAPIGGGSYAPLVNSATGSWTSATETNTTRNETVYTEVFGLGLLKDDSTTHKNLPGAKFKIWKDKACTEAVVVEATGIQGVYKHSHLNANAQNQNNEMVTPVNGKIAILGLDAGTYYLQETEAPDGYNALTAAIELKAGTGYTDFYIFADSNGNVADIQNPEGEYARNTYMVTHVTVGNSKGVELPSTGGEGAAMLITIGAVIACAFAVLLITQKKMSIYKD